MAERDQVRHMGWNMHVLNVEIVLTLGKNAQSRYLKSRDLKQAEKGERLGKVKKILEMKRQVQ